jgi:hypothetical protein
MFAVASGRKGMFPLTALTTTTPYFKLLDDQQSFRMIKVLSQDPENRVSSGGANLPP